nr:Chain B, Trypsin inhibitor 1 [Helianthus annuus]
GRCTKSIPPICFP